MDCNRLYYQCDLPSMTAVLGHPVGDAGYRKPLIKSMRGYAKPDANDAGLRCASSIVGQCHASCIAGICTASMYKVNVDAVRSVLTSLCPVQQSCRDSVVPPRNPGIGL